jgi:hypothetical protein
LSAAADLLVDRFPAYAFSLLILGQQELGKVLMLMRGMNERMERAVIDELRPISIPGFFEHETKMTSFHELTDRQEKFDKVLWSEVERSVEQLVGWRNGQKSLLPPFDSDETLHETEIYKEFMDRIDRIGEKRRLDALYVDFDEETNQWSLPYALQPNDSFKKLFEWLQRRLFKCATEIQVFLEPGIIRRVNANAKFGGALWRIDVQAKILEAKLLLKFRYLMWKRKAHSWFRGT